MPGAPVANLKNNLFATVATGKPACTLSLKKSLKQKPLPGADANVAKKAPFVMDRM